MDKTNPIRGVIPILATPFHPDESLDTESLARMIRFFAGLGVNGVTLLGVLGESNRLTDAERSTLISSAVEAAAGLPVIVGCSHPGTAATIDLCREAASLGASAAMIAPTKQLVPNDSSVYGYYKTIAANTEIPVVVQDHPASTEVHMTPKILLEIVQDIPSVVAIKAEAVPSPHKVETLTRMFWNAFPVTVLTGLGALYGFSIWSAVQMASTRGLLSRKY